jgi:CHASE2 domain-containing sensor protein
MLWLFFGGEIGLSVLVGDPLEPTANGAVTVLAFVIGLVSCWSALILGNLFSLRPSLWLAN